ncbi:hypothetical protein T4D_10637 [Trichinella pseudospiralis]|uniref:Uncharacterized protein n=1 Tax=Trichinella pseudospiralis TaxID=6337 RepID=A0A0V1F4S6_TRIPS|nr:hypothetical protein T4D_10637 [Trichinella pseudospiralis]
MFSFQFLPVTVVSQVAKKKFYTVPRTVTDFRQYLRPTETVSEDNSASEKMIRIRLGEPSEFRLKLVCL